MVAANTAIHGKPGGQRSDERSTTLLDFLLELRPRSGDFMQKPRTLAIAANTVELAVVFSNRLGLDPTLFNQH